MLTRAFAAASAIICLFTLGAARAQDYPSRPVTIIVPYAPGGGTDLMGRIVAQQLSEDTKQRFIVENKPGASGLLGAQTVADAKPDGYTLVYTSGITMATAPAMLKSTTMDFVRDLVPIAQTVVGAEVFAINPKLPAKDFGELVALMKKSPDGLKWSIGGIGSLEQFTIVALSKQVGAKALIVPYNGVAPGIAAAMSGDVDGALAPFPGLKGAIDGGQLRALATTGAERNAQIPNVPTVASLGFPSLESYNWNAIWGPKQMPKELVNNLNAKILKALTSPAARERIAAGGFDVAPVKTPEQVDAYFKAEIAKYDPILIDLGLKGSQ